MGIKGMRIATGLAIMACLSLAGRAQTPEAKAAAVESDIYHVMFVKAAPGQAMALARELQRQDPKDPMAGHFVLLRHVEGDDWDFCLIRHEGQKATVEIGPPPPPAVTAMFAWHGDTFVAGPSWPEFQRAMGLKDGPPHSVYVVSVHRAVAGHREQLREILDRQDPAAKVRVDHVTLTHVEGGRWQFLSIDRYNSWQDFGADRASSAGKTEQWVEVRPHSASHTDTLAERMP